MESLLKHCKLQNSCFFRRFIKLNFQIYIIFAYYFQTLFYHDERILSTDAAL